MFDMEEILENVRRNEEIARKLFDIEVCILSITNFKDLLERLLQLIESKFGVPYVWLSLVDDPRFSQIVEPLKDAPRLKHRLNITTLSVLLDLVGHDGAPVLENEDLRPFYRLFPRDQGYLVQSIAVAPITLDGDMVGTLNLGDSQPARFQPGMDTFFLAQLGVKVSICFSNVTSREKLRLLATRDPLTGLPNRRELELQLSRECKRAVRYRLPLSVAFVDCDDFKQVNDRYGHEAGDAFLVHVAGTLRGRLREEDFMARFAGDEFVVLLPNQGRKEAEAVLQRLAKTFEETPLHFGRDVIHGSLSYGIATSEEDPDAARLLKDADAELYRAKARKKVPAASDSPRVETGGKP